MKKILALFLALAMILAAGLACADTLEITPGTPTNCTFDNFKTYFSLMTSAAGYNFVWDETAASENGFDVYTAVSEDGAMTTRIYCADGNVSYVQGNGTLIVDMNDQASAQKFGEWLGASFSGSCLGLYAGEEGPTALADVTTQFQNELSPLLTSVTGKLTSDEQMKNGVADVTTALGYQAGLEISGGTEGTVITMNMQIFVASKDAQLAVK